MTFPPPYLPPMLRVPGIFPIGRLPLLLIRYAGWIVSHDLLDVSRGVSPYHSFQDVFDLLLARFVDGVRSHCDTQGVRESQAAERESRASSPLVVLQNASPAFQLCTSRCRGYGKCHHSCSFLAQLTQCLSGNAIGSSCGPAENPQETGVLLMD